MAGSKCITINVKGLQNAQRRTNIFETFKSLDFDIIAIQETHCDKKSVDQWMNEWDHHSLWSIGSSEKCGVGFLVGKNLQAELIYHVIAFKERFLRADVKIQGIVYQLINIYGTNATTEAQIFSKKSLNS